MQQASTGVAASPSGHGRQPCEVDAVPGTPRSARIDLCSWAPTNRAHRRAQEWDQGFLGGGQHEKPTGVPCRAVVVAIEGELSQRSEQCLYAVRFCMSAPTNDRQAVVAMCGHRHR